MKKKIESDPEIEEKGEAPGQLFPISKTGCLWFLQGPGIHPGSRERLKMQNPGPHPTAPTSQGPGTCTFLRSPGVGCRSSLESCLWAFFLALRSFADEEENGVGDEQREQGCYTMLLRPGEEAALLVRAARIPRGKEREWCWYLSSELSILPTVGKSLTSESMFSPPCESQMLWSLWCPCPSNLYLSGCSELHSPLQWITPLEVRVGRRGGRARWR